MAAFVTILGSFCLLSLLYSRLTGGSFVLLPVGWSLTVERLLWWAVLCVATWTVGAGLWRLLYRPRGTLWSVSVGSIAATCLICAAFWYAHKIDPGNEDKVFRVILPQATALAAAMLAALIAVLPKRIPEPAPVSDSGSSTLNYGRGPDEARLCVKCLVVAAVSFAIGVAAYFVKRRVVVVPFIPSQLFHLLLIFVIPAASLEWACRAAWMKRARLTWAASRSAAIGLMAVAAFVLT